MPSVHIVNLWPWKQRKELIFPRNKIQNKAQLTCKIILEAPRKDRPVREAILFYESYQSTPVIFGRKETGLSIWTENEKDPGNEFTKVCKNF